MADINISLSVIVPAYNERWRILGTLLDLIDYLELSHQSYEILVVDDGSKDETSEIVLRLAKLRPQIKLIRHAKNIGKGGAVRSGVMQACGQRVLFADADGATAAKELARLNGAIDQGAEIAIGSRALHDDEVKVSTWFHRKYLGRSFNFLVNLLLVPGIKDTQCGFKLFTARAARFLFSTSKAQGFSFDVEILHLAQKAHIPVKEVAINWTNMPGSKVNVIIDGLKMVYDVILFALRHRHVTPETYQSFLSTYPA